MVLLHQRSPISFVHISGAGDDAYREGGDRGVEELYMGAEEGHRGRGGRDRKVAGDSWTLAPRGGSKSGEGPHSGTGLDLLRLPRGQRLGQEGRRRLLDFGARGGRKPGEGPHSGTGLDLHCLPEDGDWGRKVAGDSWTSAPRAAASPTRDLTACRPGPDPPPSRTMAGTGVELELDLDLDLDAVIVSRRRCLRVDEGITASAGDCGRTGDRGRRR